MREVICTLLLVVACARPSQGPVAIAYDKETCAYCHMLIGDPRFAAQIITDAGDVYSFDDPGCLFRFVAEQHPHVRATWFRDSRRDRWLASGEVAFAHEAKTPMGWGFAAVDRNTPGARTYQETMRSVTDSAGAAR
ncbi:MAG TPA: nitrous oxide reductase accessory protein NosL [Kofleriaceae bacterium]|nr:nitrous oxide reductase accessory protein NosL [Kofleriaceae bacterium]